MAHAVSRSENCPSNDDQLGWLLLARHYALPTRLLDWSLSPMVALYFAVMSGSPEADGCLWALHPGSLNFQMLSEIDWRIIPPDDPAIMDVAAPAFMTTLSSGSQATSSVAGRVLAAGTREIDPRVVAQQATFTIHADGRDLADFQSTKQGLAPVLQKFIVPKGAKEYLHTILTTAGINRASLFPDLWNLAEELKNRDYT